VALTFWTGRDSNPRPPGCKPGDLPLIYRPQQSTVIRRDNIVFISSSASCLIGCCPGSPALPTYLCFIIKGERRGRGWLSTRAASGKPRGGRTLNYISQHPIVRCALNPKSYRPPGFIPAPVWPASQGLPVYISSRLSITSPSPSSRSVEMMRCCLLKPSASAKHASSVRYRPSFY
jgi:hypothetical protein